MDWLTPLRGQLVGIDTSPFIYLIERNPGFVERVRPFFQLVDQDEIQAVTSPVTLIEVLVRPLGLGNANLADEYRDILLNSSIKFVPVTTEVAEEAARLRSQHNLRTPDAIQLAAAITEGATAFLTNDSQLAAVHDIQVLVLRQL